jgi:hypothetical protein
MRCLVGVVIYGNSKSYVTDAFSHMANECIIPVPGVDVITASDWLPSSMVKMEPGMTFVEDMLMNAREEFRKIAIEREYDKVCYQGVDCLWQSREDFERVMAIDVPCVSALTSARDDSHAAVARRFKRVRGESGEYAGYSEEQEDIPVDELAGGGLVPSGFPGADAIFFRNDTFDESFGKDSGHVRWYDRVAQGLVNVDCMEYLCLKLINRAYERNQWWPCYVDADTRVWHVHEDGQAHMWPDRSVPLAELSW